MPVLVTDPDLESRLLEQRQASGGDRYDEVWEGVYIMAPLANNEHQSLQARFAGTLQSIIGWDSPAQICAGVNVSDRNEDWQYNYRCPDVVVFLPGNPAINRETHWQGGPDFLVEVVSDRDRALEKIPFYASVGVREALFIRRNPWSLELHRKSPSTGELELVGEVNLDDSVSMQSNVLPISLKLVRGKSRPMVELTVTCDAPDRKTWLI